MLKGEVAALGRKLAGARVLQRQRGRGLGRDGGDAGVERY